MARDKTQLEYYVLAFVQLAACQSANEPFECVRMIERERERESI